MEKTFRTGDVAPRDRFAYWREAICDAYVHLGCDTSQPVAFDGSIALHRLAGADMSFVDSEVQHVRRRRRDIGRDVDDYFLLSVQRHGTGRVVQYGREALLKPGDFALYSSTDPYDLIFAERFGQLVVQVPKRAVLDRLPIAEMLTAIPVSGRAGTGRLVGQCLNTIAAGSDGIDTPAEPHLSSTVVDLLCTGLATIAGQAPCDVSRQDTLTTLRIEAFIASNLHNPELTRADVARGMNMSVRRINELLARRGTSIRRRIQEARLERIHGTLSDPAFDGEPIGAIALKWGFNNLQHFSRAFRRQYGRAPRDMRAGRRG
jgi:AraC-like DNA-binding protein